MIWVVLLATIWLFVELADGIYEHDGFFFDRPILNWFYGLLNPVLTRVALILSVLGDVPVMLALSLLLTLLLVNVSRREAIFFASSMTGASLTMVLSKFLFARPRPELFPDVDLWLVSSPSFPSGHATGSMALWLTLFLITRHLELRHWQLVTALGGLLLVLAVSASRLYLQVHYPSDILAGLALGTAWVLAVHLLYRARSQDRTQHMVLLRLPGHLIDAYHAEAERRGQDEDTVVAEALERYFDSKP